MAKEKELKRCDWCLSSPLMMEYHDKEWGVPLHDDDKLFEFVVLDTFQAGLSWSTILNRRETFRKAFSGFNAVKISKYKEADIERLLNDPGIIRNKLKVNATVGNAKAFLAIQKEFGSFNAYIWQFTDGKTLQRKRKRIEDVPAQTPEAVNMSKQLSKRGFKFVGPTICYAFMQAAGMVNDHLHTCFRHKEV
jgi:DNA-3-methyladenine glycosylase I